MQELTVEEYLSKSVAPCQEGKVLRPPRRYGRPMLLKDIIEDVMTDWLTVGRGRHDRD